MKSQFTFDDAGPLFEMHLATMSDEMNVRDGDGVQQFLQHRYGC